MKIFAFMPLRFKYCSYFGEEKSSEPTLSYKILISTPFEAFSLRISRISFQIWLGSMIKYSIKMNFCAFFNSFLMSSKASSPLGKYFSLFFAKDGFLHDFER